MDFLRVTEILSPFTGIKYVDKAVLENAAVRGTKVHAYCEAIARGVGMWDIPQDHQGYVDSFMYWWGNGRKVLDIEKRFYCKDLGITGQVDLVTQEKDGIYIVDLKTSAQESRSWCLQGSAYSHMAKAFGYDVKKIMFLKLLKDGKPAKEYFYDENMELFKECLSVYRHFYGKKSKG